MYSSLLKLPRAPHTNIESASGYSEPARCKQWSAAPLPYYKSVPRLTFFNSRQSFETAGKPGPPLHIITGTHPHLLFSTVIPLPAARSHN